GDRVSAGVAGAAPLPGPGDLGDPPQPPAHVALALDEVDGAHAALAEDAGTLHAGGPGADDEDVVVGIRGLLELLGMPAAAGLLACGRVLRADDRRAAGLPARDAGVSADALAAGVGAAPVARRPEEGVRGQRA